MEKDRRDILGYIFAGGLGLNAGSLNASENRKDSNLVNVKDFGAKGNGVHDDTFAIRKAWDFAIGFRSKAKEGDFLGVTSSCLYFPAGDYNFNGPPLIGGVKLSVSIVGESRESVRINLGSGYFISQPSMIDSLSIKEMHFVGGSGVLNHTYRDNNVRGYVHILNCIFFGYSECALGSESPDFPYWKVENCVFYGGDEYKSFGIVIGGDVSMCEIKSNAFLRNRYHLKISNPGTNFRVYDNDFIRFSVAPDYSCDIWIVPHSTPVDACSGSVIAFNKFGNENRTAKDYSILIADESKYSSRINSFHSRKRSVGYISGLSIKDNYTNGIKGGQAFLSSYTDNIHALRLSARQYGGGAGNYLVEILGDEKEANRFSRLSQHSLIDYDSIPTATELRPSFPANKYLGLVSDPFGFYAGDSRVFSYWSGGGDPSYKRSKTLSIEDKRWKITGRASSLKFGSGVSRVYLEARGKFFSDFSGYEGARTGFLEVVLEGELNKKVGDISISICSSNSPGEIYWKRIVAIPAYKRRYRFPICLDFVEEKMQFCIQAIEIPVVFNFYSLHIYNAHEPSSGGGVFKKKVSLNFSEFEPSCSYVRYFDFDQAGMDDVCIVSFNKFHEGVFFNAFIEEDGRIGVNILCSNNYKKINGQVLLIFSLVKGGV